jgi:hypothetical protein
MMVSIKKKIKCYKISNNHNKFLSLSIEWGLSKIFTGCCGTPVHYAYHDLHYFMLTNQWNLLGNGTYIPTNTDLAAQQIIQNNMWSFLRKLQPTSQWLPANTTTSHNDINTDYVLFDMISENDLGSKIGYRSEICQYYREIELINSTFWWVN